MAVTGCIEDLLLFVGDTVFDPDPTARIREIDALSLVVSPMAITDQASEVRCANGTEQVYHKLLFPCCEPAYFACLQTCCKKPDHVGSELEVPAVQAQQDAIHVQIDPGADAQLDWFKRQ